MEELIKQFNLPEYLNKSKSFSDASKMIMKRFEERSDKASIKTMDELLGRLRDAQEFVKQQSNPPSNEEDVIIDEDNSEDVILEDDEIIENKSQEDLLTGSNTYALGGLFDKLGGSGSKANALGSAFGMAGDLAGGFMTNKDGTQDAGGSAISGALSGAGKGMALGPLGAVGGALIGGVTGLLGAKSAERARNKAQREAGALHSNTVLNTFADGGKLNPINLTPKGIDDVSTGFDTELASTTPTLHREPGFLERAFNTIKPVAQDSFDAVKTGVGSAGKFLGENKNDILRYAPVAMNAYQLATMDKPETTRLNRLDARYNPQYADEQALQNVARENFNTTAEALGSASGGSTSALRSNILGAQINRTKALSDAYSRAANVNRAENRAGQQFNLGVDKSNINQSNLETDINARDLGAYNTNKSKILAALGNDLGGIGKEGKYKDMIEKLYGYNQKGEYLNKKKRKAKAVNLKPRKAKLSTPEFNPFDVKLDI